MNLFETSDWLCGCSRKHWMKERKRRRSTVACAVTDRGVVSNVSLRALEIKTPAVFLTPCCNKTKQKTKKNVSGWAEVPPVHHTLFSVVFVCMTLLCSAAISVKAFDNSASPSLPFSSEKIFLQWKIQRKGQMSNPSKKLSLQWTKKCSH